MDMDDAVAQFTGITGTTPEIASQYIELAEGNIEQAVQLFFDSGGADLQSQDAQATSNLSSNAPPPASQRRGRNAYEDEAGIVHIDSDDEEAPAVRSTSRRTRQAEPTSAASPRGVEDDEAMARRLQEEMYGAGSAGPGAGGMVDDDGVRAPIGRTTETLVGPESGMGFGDEDDLQAAITEQLQRRTQMSRGGRAGELHSILKDCRTDLKGSNIFRPCRYLQPARILINMEQ